MHEFRVWAPWPEAVSVVTAGQTRPMRQGSANGSELPQKAFWAICSRPFICTSKSSFGQ